MKLSTPGKRGRPRKTMAAQSILHDESILLQSIIDSDQEYNDSDVEEDRLLQQMKTTTANRPIRPKWLATYEKLKEYKVLHGTIEPLYSDTNNTAIGSVAEDNNNNNEEFIHLKSWVKNQRNMQARWKQGYDTGMTKEKEDVRFLKCYLRVFCESLLPDCVHHVTIYHPLSLNHLN